LGDFVETITNNCKPPKPAEIYFENSPKPNQIEKRFFSPFF